MQGSEAMHDEDAPVFSALLRTQVCAAPGRPLGGTAGAHPMGSAHLDTRRQWSRTDVPGCERGAGDGGRVMSEMVLQPGALGRLLHEQLAAEILARVLAEVRVRQGQSSDGRPVWLEPHQLVDTPAVAMLATHAALVALTERGDVVSGLALREGQARAVFTLASTFDGQPPEAQP